MTAKQAAVKTYVVKLCDEERERFTTLVRKGKHRAGQLVKARILLRADASEAGDGWSDSEIAAALGISRNTIARTRQPRRRPPMTMASHGASTLARCETGRLVSPFVSQLLRGWRVPAKFVSQLSIVRS